MARKFVEIPFARGRGEKHSQSSDIAFIGSTRHDISMHTCLLACLLATFSLCASLCLGGNTYMTVFNLPARRQPHSVFWAFMHASTICLFLDP